MISRKAPSLAVAAMLLIPAVRANFHIFTSAGSKVVICNSDNYSSDCWCNNQGAIFGFENWDKTVDFSNVCGYNSVKFTGNSDGGGGTVTDQSTGSTLATCYNQGSKSVGDCLAYGSGEQQQWYDEYWCTEICGDY